jgi:hypothetical protein
VLGGGSLNVYFLMFYNIACLVQSFEIILFNVLLLARIMLFLQKPSSLLFPFYFFFKYVLGFEGGDG